MSLDACIHGVLCTPQYLPTATFLHEIISDFLISTRLICLLFAFIPKSTLILKTDETMNVLGLALMFTLCWKLGKWHEIKRPPVLVPYLPWVSCETLEIRFLLCTSMFSYMTWGPWPRWPAHTLLTVHSDFVNSILARPRLVKMTSGM